jgi:hypothetical protein
MGSMIQLKNDESSARDRGLLFIDGILMDKVYLYLRDEETCELTINDSETSRAIAAYSLSDFPRRVEQMFILYHPNDLEHLNKQSTIFISHEWVNRQPTNKYTVYIEFGGDALSRWKAPYTFAAYAKEMYQILKARKDLIDVGLSNIHEGRIDRMTELGGAEPIHTPVALEQIDESRIHRLNVEFPYSSPEVKIADELDRMFSILRETNNEAVNIVTARLQDNSLKIMMTGSDATTRYQLFVNGSLLEGSSALALNGTNMLGSVWHIELENNEALYGLGDNRFFDIPEKVTTIAVKLEPKLFSRWEQIQASPEIRIRTPESSHYLVNMETPKPFPNDYSITFFFDLDVNNWRGQYSPRQYIDETAKFFAYDPNVRVYSPDVTEYGFNITFRIASSHLRIVDEVLRCRHAVSRFLDEIETEIFSDSSSHSIVTSFNFPKEVAVSCEQYLQYFIQFLRDLGVEATSELKHKAGQVLFTVTPVDEREALDKIQTALNIYLELPTSPVSIDTENEIAVLRLESTVHRLQSDFKLAAAELKAKVAEIESKNSTIESQRIIINVQKSLLDGEIFKDSLRDITPKTDDDENILGGTVILSKIGKGVQVNLAETYRKLKRFLKEK